MLRLEVLEETVNIQTGGCQHILGLHKDVFDKSRGNDAQPDFTINTAKGEIVDFVSEGRNVGPFAGVEVDHEDVIALEVEVRREFEGERRVPASVFAQTHAVDPHR